MNEKLAALQQQLELDQDITRFQPPQVSVVDDNGNVKVVLLTNTDLGLRYQLIQAACDGADMVDADTLQGVNFRISERYRCFANPRGQAQGGMGFIYEGVDLLEGTKVRPSTHIQVNSACDAVPAPCRHGG